MKQTFTTLAKRFANRAATLAVAMASVVFVATATSCADDETTTPSGNFTEGVQPPSKTTFDRNMQAAKMGLSFTTESSYKLDVDNAEMITLLTGIEGSKGGTHTVEFELSANESSDPRTGSIYITVKGHNRTKLFEITQAGNSITEVVKWIDERLSKEYYWLDEYVEKRGTFDYGLAYNKFLSSSLMSLTTNIDDGGVYSDGTRYLYSYIHAIDQTRADGDGSTLPTVNSYGIWLSSYFVPIEDGVYAMAVDHVYPSSPAAEAGLKRGDMIYKVNGENLPSLDTNYSKARQIWSDLQHGTGSVEIAYKTLDTEQSKYVDKSATLNSAAYSENPVAYCDILPLEEKHNPDGKKVGYISYLSFDADFDKPLVDSIQMLADKGATDVILDLRVNSGGSLNSCIYLSSMMVDDSYNDKHFVRLLHNPKNKRYEDVDYSVVDQYVSASEVADLPRLGLKKLWVIASEFSASASELVIVGLRGLDLPIEVIGTTTEGKNNGMEVQERTIDGVTYEFAPITFFIENAKGFSDYGDGIEPEVNLADYINDTSVSDNLRSMCRMFPVPNIDWGVYNRDIALAEAVTRIGLGKSLFDKAEDAESVFQPSLSTRAQMPALEVAGKINAPVNNGRRISGLYVTEAEMAAHQKSNE